MNRRMLILEVLAIVVVLALLVYSSCRWQRLVEERADAVVDSVAAAAVPDVAAWRPVYDTLTVLLTVYDSVSGVNGGSRTCTGRKLRVGDCAADLSVLPLGTVVYIPDRNLRLVVSDCGGAIRGNRLDWFRPGSSGDRRLWVRESTTVIALVRKEKGGR